MPLNNPEKRGLKSYTLHNQTKDVVKVGTLSIPAGDEITVSETVARQMLGADPGLKLTSGELPDTDQASPFPAAVVADGEVVDSHPTFDPPVLDPDGVIEEHPKNRDQVKEVGGDLPRQPKSSSSAVEDKAAGVEEAGGGSGRARSGRRSK
jgi:hypothetical protein